MVNKNILWITTVLLVLALALGACTTQPAATEPVVEQPAEQAQAPVAEEAAAEKIVIGYSAPNAGWPYIAAFINALEAAAAADDSVELIVLSADGDIAKQSSDFDNLIAQGVDVILVCSLDGSAIVPSLKAASDAGIPVLAVSNEPSEEGQQYIVGFSGPDDYVQGRIAAELMADALGGKGNIVVIEGTPGQSTTALRNQGFADQTAEAGYEFTILASQTSNWDPVQAKSVMEDFITAYGDQINGVFSQDDNTAAAAAEVLKEKGLLEKIAVVGTGGSKNGTQAIRDGLLYGTMDQSPTTDANQALGFAKLIASGGELPERRNIIPMPKITIENADQFPGEW
jgi:ribose transport system substrate-binding protein